MLIIIQRYFLEFFEWLLLIKRKKSLKYIRFLETEMQKLKRQGKIHNVNNLQKIKIDQ